MASPKELPPPPSAEFVDELTEVLQGRGMSRLHNRALRYTRNVQSAEDLVGDTLARASAKWQRYRPGTDMISWLLSIERNLFISSFRKLGTTPSTVPVDDVPEEYLHRRAVSRPPVTESVVEEEVGHAAVVERVHALPGRYREVAVLALVEERSYKEIAEMLRIPVGSVCSRLSRARKQLQPQFKALP